MSRTISVDGDALDQLADLIHEEHADKENPLARFCKKPTCLAIQGIIAGAE